MVVKVTIRVTGEDDAARALGRFLGDLRDETDEASRRIASQTAEDAASRAYSIGGVAAHVAGAIVAQGPDVGLDGGGALPMAMGAEFGRDSLAQFDAWTGSGETSGYFLIPTIKANEAERLNEYENAVQAAIRRFDT